MLDEAQQAKLRGWFWNPDDDVKGDPTVWFRIGPHAEHNRLAKKR